MSCENDVDLKDLTPFVNLIDSSGVASNDVMKEKLLNLFLDSGADTIQDLGYLEEDHLKVTLPVIKRKKLLSYIANVLAQNFSDNMLPVIEQSPVSVVAQEYPEFEGSCTSKSNVSEELFSSDADTASTLADADDVQNGKDIELVSTSFQFPWERVPKHMKDWLGIYRPDPSEKMKFVQIVIDAVLEINSKPSRSYLRPIAKALVEMFPKSFKIEPLSGRSVNSDLGTYGLLRQLEQRIQNLQKSACHKSGTKRKKQQDHGCKFFHPPSHKTDDEFEQIRLELLTLYQEQSDMPLAISKFSEAFPGLRNVIISGIAIDKLKEAWPFLFTREGLYSHYNTLVDGHSLEEFEKIYIDQLTEFKCFMQSLQSKHLGLRQVCVDIETAKAKKPDNQDVDVLGLMLLLINYFDENVIRFYRKHENDDKDKKGLPCIITFGQPLLQASVFGIILDGRLICHNISSSLEALATLFATYYVFNVQYPDELSVTMQFLESQIAGINPLSGTCKGKAKNKRSKSEGIATKIIKLIEKFELWKQSINSE